VFREIGDGIYGVAYSLSAMAFLFSSAMTPIITREYSKFLWKWGYKIH